MTVLHDKTQLFTFKGILQGITASSTITKTKVQFLSHWLELTPKRSPRQFKIYSLSQEILSNTRSTMEKVADLHSEISNFLIETKYEPTDSENAKKEFIGLLKGTCSDNKLCRLEFDRIESWLKRNSEYSNIWPISLMAEKVETIWLSKTVTFADLENIYQLITTITQNIADNPDISPCPLTEHNDSIPFKNLNGINVCCVGQLISGSLPEIASKIKAKQGQIHQHIHQNTDIVVVGALGRQNWLTGKGGKVIERALELREEGRKIIITTEETFFDFCRPPQVSKEPPPKKSKPLNGLLNKIISFF